MPDFSPSPLRSEEHTSELQSQSNLVCRLLLEKKKTEAFSDRIGVRSSDYNAGNNVKLPIHDTLSSLAVYFFFNDTATTEIYTLSLHDALPIFAACFSSTTACAAANRAIGTR